MPFVCRFYNNEEIILPPEILTEEDAVDYVWHHTDAKIEHLDWKTPEELGETPQGTETSALAGADRPETHPLH